MFDMAPGSDRSPTSNTSPGSIPPRFELSRVSSFVRGCGPPFLWRFRGWGRPFVREKYRYIYVGGVNMPSVPPAAPPGDYSLFFLHLVDGEKGCQWGVRVQSVTRKGPSRLYNFSKPVISAPHLLLGQFVLVRIPYRVL